MKEIKNKILDCLANENFNQELIGDKVKLQNKINKLQKIIDVINVLQPLEDEFVLPKQYYFLCETELEFETALNYFKNKYKSFFKHTSFKDYFAYKSFKGFYVAEKDGDFGYHNNTEHYKKFTEITFEQFEKYVLNQ